MARFIISFLFVCLLGCEEVDSPTVYESAIFVHWSNGYQTAHYMFGPLPGNGESLNPTPEWYWPLKGATANATSFFFNQPTVKADQVIWRVVWVPHKTEARLVVAFEDRLDHELVTFTTQTVNSQVSQKTEHPVNNPRAVDVDITSEFNSAIDRRERADFAWQVRKL